MGRSLINKKTNNEVFVDILNKFSEDWFSVIQYINPEQKVKMDKVVLVSTLLDGDFVFKRSLDAEAFISFFSSREQDLIEKKTVTVFDGPHAAYNSIKNKKVLCT